MPVSATTNAAVAVVIVRAPAEEAAAAARPSARIVACIFAVTLGTREREFIAKWEKFGKRKRKITKRRSLSRGHFISARGAHTAQHSPSARGE